jgi:hypothetical protein
MMPKSEKPLNDLDSLLSLAGQCDQAAATLAMSSKQLFDRVLELKGRTGKGPTGAVVANSLERITARYFAGSCLIRVQRGRHPSCSTFRAAVTSWLPALSRPEPIQPATAAKRQAE